MCAGWGAHTSAHSSLNAAGFHVAGSTRALTFFSVLGDLKTKNACLEDVEMAKRATPSPPPLAWSTRIVSSSQESSEQRHAFPRLRTITRQAPT